MKFIFATMAFLIQFLAAEASVEDRLSIQGIVQSYSDTPSVIISQNSKYLVPGQEIVITVRVCNTDRLPKISVNDISVPFNNEALASITMMGGSVGFHRIPVEVTFPATDSGFRAKTYFIEYEVGQAFVAIDEGNLNLLYIGVDNPLYIYALGVPSHKLKVEISSPDATISRSSNGSYIARVKTMTDTCYIDVYADHRINGRKKFRVIYPPEPKITIDGRVSSDHITKADWRKANGVLLLNLDFNYKMDYQVNAFNLKVITSAGAVKSFKCSGSTFPSEVKQYIAYAPVGSMIVIEDLAAIEKSIGKIKTSPVVFYIK